MEKMRPERSGLEVRERAEGTSGDRSAKSGEGPEEDVDVEVEVEVEEEVEEVRAEEPAGRRESDVSSKVFDWPVGAGVIVMSLLFFISFSLIP